MPTETVYGLAADAGNEAALRAIFTAKGRPADHPVIVHIPDAAAMHRWAVDVPAAADALAAAFWPGPLTLVLKRGPARLRSDHRRTGHRRPALSGPSLGAGAAEGLWRWSRCAERQPLRSHQPDHGAARGRGSRPQAGRGGRHGARRRAVSGRYRVDDRRPVRPEPAPAATGVDDCASSCRPYSVCRSKAAPPARPARSRMRWKSTMRHALRWKWSRRAGSPNAWQRCARDGGRAVAGLGRARRTEPRAAPRWRRTSVGVRAAAVRKLRRLDASGAVHLIIARTAGRPGLGGGPGPSQARISGQCSVRSAHARAYDRVPLGETGESMRTNKGVNKMFDFSRNAARYLRGRRRNTVPDFLRRQQNDTPAPPPFASRRWLSLAQVEQTSAIAAGLRQSNCLPTPPYAGPSTAANGKLYGTTGCRGATAPLSAASSAGGTNFAVAGAVTGVVPDDTVRARNVPNMQVQHGTVSAEKWLCGESAEPGHRRRHRIWKQYPAGS